MIKENNIITDDDGYVKRIKISFVISDNKLIESIVFSIYKYYPGASNKLMATITDEYRTYTMFLDCDKFNIELADSFATYLSKRIGNVLSCDDVLQISCFMTRYFKYNKLL